MIVLQAAATCGLGLEAPVGLAVWVVAVGVLAVVASVLGVLAMVAVPDVRVMLLSAWLLASHPLSAIAAPRSAVTLARWIRVGDGQCHDGRHALATGLESQGWRSACQQHRAKYGEGGESWLDQALKWHATCRHR
ncbi:MAG: hypothetical protein M3Y17_01410 [Actinomycetota bacterium]|nr:hypothetical protein [Actinomycetota bacterium]